MSFRSLFFFLFFAFWFDPFHCALVGKIPSVAAPVATVVTGQARSKTLYFFKTAVAGAISCSLMHSFMVPLEVMKVRFQTDATLAKMNMFAGLQSIVRKDGIKVLAQGLAATSSGYFLQGATKFGFYEFFKSELKAISSNTGIAFQPSTRLPLLIASSGLAEVIASFALCPMEVTKLQMMTRSKEATKEGMISMMRSIVRNGGVGALFSGLPFILLRQVPYTCVKLVGYDVLNEYGQDVLSRFRKKRKRNNEGAEESGSQLHRPHSSSVTTLNKVVAASRTQGIVAVRGSDVHQGHVRDNQRGEGGDNGASVVVQILCGVCAGVLAATVSHPADVLLSKVCGTKANLLAGSVESCLVVTGPGSLLGVMRELGVSGCYAGLQPRAIMTGFQTAGQFLIFEAVKVRLKANKDDGAKR